ncbi:hypothetical protein [Sorangium sp. So ce1182]|uniref:hypothetical protein n=1 Tax=Sorangium sp. So ce1182 TaxID=3133334 RepID=UPI003F5D5940
MATTATLGAMQIREFAEGDWSQVWTIVREVVQAQETFVYDPEMTVEQAHDIWVEVPPGLTVVAVEDNCVLGTAPEAYRQPATGR